MSSDINFNMVAESRCHFDCGFKACYRGDGDWVRIFVVCSLYNQHFDVELDLDRVVSVDI